MGARATRTAFVIASLGLGACRSCREPQRRIGPTLLEATIGHELSMRTNASVLVSCRIDAPPQPHCWGFIADGTLLPIALATTVTGWDWQIDGLLVRALDVESQVHAALVDLDRDQTVACGARVRRIAPDDVVACALGGGGQAFVRIAADGGMVLELELEAAAAAARGEARTPDREAALAQESTALSDPGEDEDDEMSPDGGAAASVDASAGQL